MAKSKVASIRATGQASEARPLPDAARAHLGTLVTELGGLGRALRLMPVEGEDYDQLAALSLWVDRIAHDLATLECQGALATAEAP